MMTIQFVIQFVIPVVSDHLTLHVALPTPVCIFLFISFNILCKVFNTKMTNLGYRYDNSKKNTILRCTE